MIRKIIIVVLTLGAGGALVFAYLTRATVDDDRVYCWCSNFGWNGQVAFEYGHMIVHKDKPTSGTPLNWCKLQAMAGQPMYWPDASTLQSWNAGEVPRYYRERWLARLGFRWMRQDRRSWFFSVPLWFLFLLFGAYPTYAFLRGPVLRNWRRKRGLCAGCSYDLTGNVSGVCPECGTEIETT